MNDATELETSSDYPNSPQLRNRRAPHPAFGWLALLTPAQGRLLLVLWGFADLGERAPRVFPNNATLAHWCGTQRAAVRRTLGALAEAGAVRVLHDVESGRRWIELQPSPSDPRRAAGKRKPRPAKPAPREQLELPTQGAQGGPDNDQGGDQEGPPPPPNLNPRTTSELPEEPPERESARARGSASPEPGRANWRAVLASIHEGAPTGAARSVDPRKMRRAPDGLEDLIAELGGDRVVALWRAYAAICSRDAAQRAWWGPLMFSARQAAIVARLAAPEIERIESQRQAEVERRKREAEAEAEAARLEREHPIRSAEDADRLAAEFFARWEVAQ